MNGRAAKYYRKKARRDNNALWAETLDNNLWFRIVLAFCIICKIKIDRWVKE